MSRIYKWRDSLGPVAGPVLTKAELERKLAWEEMLTNLPSAKELTDLGRHMAERLDLLAGRRKKCTSATRSNDDWEPANRGQGSNNAD